MRRVQRDSSILLGGGQCIHGHLIATLKHAWRSRTPVAEHS
jgi:hypothetical protein